MEPIRPSAEVKYFSRREWTGQINVDWFGENRLNLAGWVEQTGRPSAGTMAIPIDLADQEAMGCAKSSTRSCYGHRGALRTAPTVLR